MENKYLLNILILIFLLTGCTKKNNVVSQKKSTPIQDIPQIEYTPTSDLTNEEIQHKIKNKDLVNQAKQQILAIPVGYKIKGYSESNNSGGKCEHFIYGGSLSKDMVIKFYKRELELNGWLYSDLSTKKEGLIVADKSSKKCVVSIRSSKSNSSSIHIFIQDKQRNSNSSNFVNLNNINKGEHSW